MLFYVYVLQSKKDFALYIGYSCNLKNRIEEHNYGEVASTKSNRPWELIFYEAYKNKQDALRREKYLKTTKGKQTLKSMLQEYFSENIR